MEYKDYYHILSVGRDASQDEIKRSYRKLARKYHPDVSKEVDAETHFKELNEAYEVLKDPEKRAAYDQLGANWQAGQEFRPPPDWNQGFEFHGGGYTETDPENFSDFFESLFGGGGFAENFGRSRGRNYNSRGNNTHAKITIDLADTYLGATRSLSLKHSVLGKDGRPQIKTRTLNVKIPQGICQGQQIRLAGQGEQAAGGAGDLYLEVEFKPDPNYHVEGNTVFVEVPVAPWEAALGRKIRVPTPKGAVELSLPANSQNGSKLRLKGRGIPSKTAGDLYVVTRIVLPPAKTDAEKAAYSTFEQSFSFNPRAGLGV